MALNGPILDHNASDCNVECYAWCLRCNAAPLLPTLPSHPADGADAGVHPPHPHGGPPNAVIIAASVAAAVILLAVSYFAVLRRRRRLRSLPAPAPPTAGSRDGDDGDDGFDGASEEVHHVWYIRTMGLDESAIASLAVAEYNAGEPLLAGGCAVCLGEFRDGELVRLLPKCGHAFHVPCIDTWLRAHVNCPLCRAEVVSPAASAAAAAADASDLGSPSSAATAGVADPGNTSAGSPAPVENTQMGIPPSESDREIEELEGEDGLMENVNGIGIGIDPLAVFGSPAEISDLRVTNDLVEGGLQPVRRSVSMDSPFLGALHVRVPPEGSFRDTAKDSSFGEESVAQDRGKQGSGSKGIVLQKEMERSLSSSGRGFFFVRYGRVARNSILPL